MNTVDPCAGRACLATGHGLFNELLVTFENRLDAAVIEILRPSPESQLICQITGKGTVRYALNSSGNIEMRPRQIHTMIISNRMPCDSCEWACQNSRMPLQVSA